MSRIPAWHPLISPLPYIPCRHPPLTSHHFRLELDSDFYLISHTRQRGWLKREGGEWSWTWSRSAWIHPLSFFSFFSFSLRCFLGGELLWNQRVRAIVWLVYVLYTRMCLNVFKFLLKYDENEDKFVLL